MPLFVIETISNFRHKYVIDCKSLDDAYDTVAMEEASEFSQMHLGEHLMSGKQITEQEFEQMNAALQQHGDGTEYRPESGSPWLGKKSIHVVDYANLITAKKHAP